MDEQNLGLLLHAALQRLANVAENIGDVEGVVLKAHGESFGFDAAGQRQAHHGDGHLTPSALGGQLSLVGRLLFLQQVIERRAGKVGQAADAVAIFGEPFQQRCFQNIVVGVEAMLAL